MQITMKELLETFEARIEENLAECRNKENTDFEYHKHFHIALGIQTAKSILEKYIMKNLDKMKTNKSSMQWVDIERKFCKDLNIERFYKHLHWHISNRKTCASVEDARL